MRYTTAIIITLCTLCPKLGMSELVINYSTQNGTSTDVIKDDTLFKLEDGQLIFMATADGDCSLFITDQKTRVDEKCKDIGPRMKQVVNDVMKAQGITPEQMEMMKSMRGSGAADINPKPAGEQTVAGYSAECYEISSRLLCFSDALSDKVEKHFDYRDIAGALSTASENGFQNTENSELLKLHTKGYLVKDVSAGNGGTPNIPGFKFLPKEAQEQILAKMGGSASGGGEVGTVLKSVEEKDYVITIPDYTRESIESFAKKQLK